MYKYCIHKMIFFQFYLHGLLPIQLSRRLVGAIGPKILARSSYSQRGPAVIGIRTWVLTVASPGLLPLSYPTIPWHQPGYLRGTCMSLTRNYSAIPLHRSGYLRDTCIPWHRSYLANRAPIWFNFFALKESRCSVKCPHTGTVISAHSIASFY